MWAMSTCHLFHAVAVGEKVKQVDRQWLLAGVCAKPGGEAGRGHPEGRSGWFTQGSCNVRKGHTTQRPLPFRDSCSLKTSLGGCCWKQGSPVLPSSQERQGGVRKPEGGGKNDAYSAG